ncbi:hypothetical protein, partial [Staphylococcus haemolyticus]|uniref:hypothetical protein n=4 Tax=Staphylococcus haemolyticus TaxID=1283 RepID=UPI0021B6BE07
YKKDNFYIISIEIVFFSLIQELYVPDSFLFLDNMIFHIVIIFRKLSYLYISVFFHFLILVLNDLNGATVLM